MFAKLLSLSLLALALPITTLASYHGNPIMNRNHHHDIARRADGNVDLFKRVTGARWSFYNVETGSAGSCGSFHTNGDFTVAMNVAQMVSSMCYKNIRMTYNGKTTIASVTDTCPGCPWGGLDLTEGLFAFFAPSSAGIIYGEWEFTDASNNPPPPPPPPPIPTWHPATTWVPPPPPPTPTVVYKPTTTSTPTPTPSSTKASSSKHSSASSSASVNSSSAVPTGTTPGKVENLAGLTQAFVQIGGIALAGSKI